MFNSAIIKLTNFCNLNCTYCYMFNLEDHTYQRISKYMDIETMLQFLDALEEYMDEKGLDNFNLTLHGGEPTLWPVACFNQFFDRVRKLRVTKKIRVSIQTNGFKLDLPLFRLFKENEVSVGISLDGPPEINDLSRIDHAGKGSYHKIMKNIKALYDAGLEDIIGGFLMVVNPALDPVQCIEWIESLPISKVDLLWPIEYNYDNPPWKHFGLSEQQYQENPVIGQWYTAVFKEWFQKDMPDIYIRHFYEIIYHFLGSKKHTDSIVNDQVNMFVLNTDGNYEYHDYFRGFADGRTRTPYFAGKHSITDVENDKIFQKLFELGSFLPKACSECSNRAICGGGFLPGRMKQAASEFSLSSKSILCYDQMYFFTEARKIIESKFQQLVPAVQRQAS